ncbi:hypothetical protein SAMN05428989_2400 [Pseudoxanthomonas sp. GM95]|uniref:alpha/beta hydrolase domain-containing protein n=1 Tax=Pseudoxanthomonas sp. GM95 TaxID=1881043 RepID=UPI0008AC70E3|nr:alpha/beta hydrolase domain-containing protein [Pseudoxanthomonas sp. GM95]SEL74674.1 hypothetical protein SAMN05428989_2400 [Pseudoxanthomonas sp. GM95]
MKRTGRSAWLLATFWIAALPQARAAQDAPDAPRITLEITSREDVPGDWGNVGGYEKLTGVIHGEVDPADPHNAIIQDLQLADRNARGMLDYASEFVLLKPKDMSKASGVLRYDAPNRGSILTWIDPARTPGDAVYFERGTVLLYAAWQGDVPKSSPQRLTLSVPLAHNADGSSITGPYRAELVPNQPTPSMSLPGGTFNASMLPYAPASLDTAQPGYSLTRRVNESDARQSIAAQDWAFARCDAEHPFPGTPDPASVCLRAGFDPQYLYEVVYVAKDPKVMGVGLAALRDVVSFFRHDAQDSDGRTNPLAGHIHYALAEGTSQSGNLMKTFMHLGFNQARDGSKVFDGIYAQVAARLTNINARFAVPGSAGGLRADRTAFGQMGPRALAPDYVDGLTGERGGLMARCTATQTCPKFFLGLSGTEFWQLQGAPVLSDASGARDLKQPADARIYYYAGAQHGGPGGTESIHWDPKQDVYPRGTVVQFNDTFRALWIALEDWVVKGTPPPDSRAPRITDGTLVAPKAVKFPVMRGVSWPVDGTPTPIPAFNYLARVNRMTRLDFGPQYNAKDESGIATVLPPRDTGRLYAPRVPQVDPKTGIGIAGVHSVEALAPLGTSLEFDYVARPGIVDLSTLAGSFIPFHATEAARKAAGDTRPSLESLYGMQAGYVAAVRKAADKLVAQRLLLPRDAERLVNEAKARKVLP